MPKRKADALNGLRIELNEKERELIETQIWVNGVSKAIQGLGTAVAGAGMGVGLFAAALVFHEKLDDVVDWVKDKSDLGKEEWEEQNLAVGDFETPGTYQYYFNERQRLYDSMVARTGQTNVSFQEWEAANYDEPPMTYEAWASQVRSKEVRRRRSIVGAIPGIGPVLTGIGILEHGPLDYVKGQK